MDNLYLISVILYLMADNNKLNFHKILLLWLIFHNQ